MVVSSLVIETFLALPSMSMVTFSSLMPRSSLISWPPVRVAMSSSMALRRSPKPGAFTAATLRPPRSLLTTRVASASPSMSSAMIKRGRDDCTTASSTGSSGCSEDSFFSLSRMSGSSSWTSILSARRRRPSAWLRRSRGADTPHADSARYGLPSCWVNYLARDLFMSASKSTRAFSTNILSNSVNPRLASNAAALICSIDSTIGYIPSDQDLVSNT